MFNCNVSFKAAAELFLRPTFSSLPQAKQEAQIIRLLVMLMTYPLIIVVIVLWDKDIMFFEQGCEVLTDLSPDIQERDHNAKHPQKAERRLQGAKEERTNFTSEGHSG